MQKPWKQNFLEPAQEGAEAGGVAGDDSKTTGSSYPTTLLGLSTQLSALLPSECDSSRQN